MNLIYNFVCSRWTTHTTAVVVAFLTGALTHIMNDPSAHGWMQTHWLVRDLVETATVGVPTAAVYLNPLSHRTP